MALDEQQRAGLERIVYLNAQSLGSLRAAMALLGAALAAALSVEFGHFAMGGGALLGAAAGWLAAGVAGARIDRRTTARAERRIKRLRERRP